MSAQMKEARYENKIIGVKRAEELVTGNSDNPPKVLTNVVFCSCCNASIRFTGSYRKEKSTRQVNAYFSLNPGKVHTPECCYNVPRQVEIIAGEAGPMISKHNGRYIFRLNYLVEDLKSNENTEQKRSASNNGSLDTSIHITATHEIPQYISSALKLAELRSRFFNNQPLEDVELEYRDKKSAGATSTFCLRNTISAFVTLRLTLINQWLLKESLKHGNLLRTIDR